MKHIEHELGGAKRDLSCTANAIFTLYDEYGYSADIVEDLHLCENTEEGWKNTCYCYALFAAQGELQRRLMGYEPQKMITMEDVRLMTAPTEAPGVKRAVIECLNQGFTRDAAPKDEEIDLVLMDIETREKKKKASAAIALLTSLRQSISSICQSRKHSS